MFVSFCFLMFFSTTVFAEPFVLEKIGALQTLGKKYNRWYYEPQRVTLSGTGSRGANIDITLDGQFNTVKASVQDGKWLFDPGKMLEKADHSITVASGNESYPFILTIGSATESAQSNTAMPIAGNLLPFVGVGLISGYLIYLGLRKDSVSI